MKKFIADVDTTFKVCVWWKYKKGTNELYTEAERKDNKNRKYLGSHDYYVTANGRTITDHSQALTKLYGMLRKHHRFYTAIVYWRSLQGEIIMSKWSDGKMICSPRKPDFKVGGKFLDEIFINGVGGPEILSNTTGPVKFIDSEQRIIDNRGKTYSEMVAQKKAEQRATDEAEHARLLAAFTQKYNGTLPPNLRP